MSQVIYKVVPAVIWQAARNDGIFRGAEIDIRDGYIHFSTAKQLGETIRLHFAGQQDLLIVAVSIDALDAPIKWEPSRGGELFPHLYGELPLSSVKEVIALPVDSDGHHRIPELKDYSEESDR